MPIVSQQHTRCQMTYLICLRSACGSATRNVHLRTLITDNARSSSLVRIGHVKRRYLWTTLNSPINTNMSRISGTEVARDIAVKAGVASSTACRKQPSNVASLRRWSVFLRIVRRTSSSLTNNVEPWRQSSLSLSHPGGKTSWTCGTRGSIRCSRRFSVKTPKSSCYCNLFWRRGTFTGRRQTESRSCALLDDHDD